MMIPGSKGQKADERITNVFEDCGNCKTVQKIFSELCVNWSQCLKIEFYE